jgi:hypothetical protein
MEADAAAMKPDYSFLGYSTELLKPSGLEATK